MPLTEVVLEIRSVVKIVCRRRALTGCFGEENKPTPPWKAKTNKKIYNSLFKQ